MSHISQILVENKDRFVEKSVEYSKIIYNLHGRKQRMELLHIEASAHTPLVNLNPQNGIMEIRGRSIPEDPESFWGGILQWFDDYMKSPATKTVVKIDLEYFNITSSKRILFLLYKLNELVDAGLDAQVEWYYRKSDEDMYEVGQDYAFMVRVPFDFKEYSDSDFALV
jgi:hypothetical protein